MDHLQISDMIREQMERLDKAQHHLFKQATKKAETERLYRMALAQEIFKLRSEGYPVALIADLSRGSTAEEKFERDLAESQFRATVEVIDTIKVNISALQSMLRFYE